MNPGSFSFKNFAAPLRLLSGAASTISGLVATLAPVTVLGLAGLGFSGNAAAVNCGTFSNNICTGTDFQYAGGFNPAVGEYGGFGGAANCVATRTPVIFVHGNGDSAPGWDSPPAQVPGYPKAPLSVYQAFKAAGYKDCELFGVSYLSASERKISSVQYNYHKSSKYAIIENFIRKVKTYTGKTKVDIVGHSMGVSMSIAALTYYSDWGSVRRFVNIGGALKGLDSCLWVGYANAYAPTCGSQNWWDSSIFGFYPDAAYPGINSWTGSSSSKAMSNSAIQHPATSFYTIWAGTRDEAMCTTVSNFATCKNTALFKSASNVKAQLDVGAGSNALKLNWDWSTGSPFNSLGGDTNGVGHLRSRSNTGSIIVKMLSTTCTTGCAVDYVYGPVN